MKTDNHMSPKNLIVAIVLGGALAAGIFVATKLNKPANLQTAFVLPLPNALPDFSLLDQSGDRVNADTFRGQWDLVFFGFTNCPDICPTTLQVLASAKRELIESGARTLPRVVLVSVDPERDTPELLGQYVDYFGEGNLGVTGELEGIKTLTAALGIYFEKAPTDDGNYGVDHSAAVLVINPDGEFSALFSAPHTVANFVHDLPIVMGGN
jgi:protein SCO1/2